MPKLHQVLAVEADLEGKYKRICMETLKVFGKPALFTGSHRKLESFEENSVDHPEEHQELTTTVAERVEYTSNGIGNYLDAVYQKEATNQTAMADLVIDGDVLLENMPATFLLALESRLKFIRGIYEAMPTLTSGVGWERSADKGDNIWDMKHPEEKIKTKLNFKSQILVPAQFPKEGESGTSLPAQIEKWEEQEPVGKFVKHIWSGMITSHQKAETLERIDKLIRGAKMARQKANSTPVVTNRVAIKLMNYINSPL